MLSPTALHVSVSPSFPPLLLYLYTLHTLSIPLSISPLLSLYTCLHLTVSVFLSFLQDRWGEQDYSSFSPRWLPIHQGHSCVWIMSELWSKYLSMTSCLDWCSCAIWCFMYHALDCLAASLAREGLPCQCPWNTEKENGLTGQAQICNAAENVTLTLSCSDEVLHWGNTSDMVQIEKKCPFRHVDQFGV